MLMVFGLVSLMIFYWESSLELQLASQALVTAYQGLA
jgi:hypothetical protein